MSTLATCPPVLPSPKRCLLVSLLLLLPLLALRPASAANDLYPDLSTLPPRDLRFATVTLAGTAHRVLQFSNTVVNTGAGRLDVVGVIDPTTRNGPAYQRVYDDAGNYVQYRAGSLTWHDVHSHFHYDGWGRYELWSRADYDKWVASGRSQGQAKKVGSKTTSCIMDEEFIRELPGTPYPKVYGSDGCDLRSDNTLHEGLSPGWGDTYDWYRDEQWIDLDQTPLTDGDYVLRSVTDPSNMVYESSGRADASREDALANEGVTSFTVSAGRLLDGTAPTGTVTLNNTARSTTSSTVTVSAMGRDDVSGVDSFRLSNDGSSWRTFPYTPNSSAPTSVSWSLVDPAYGGSASTGVKTVYAQFHDVSGKWGTTTTDTITWGSTASAPPPSAGYAGVVAADGPVGYWRLGEASGATAADAVGTSPGTYLGAPQLGQPSLVPTDSDTSVGFTGSSSVRVPDAPSLRLTAPLSLEAWINPTTLPGAGAWASVVTKAESYSLQFNGQQLELTVIQNGSRKRLKAPAGSVVAGRTSHVVGTYDGTTERLYVNGSLVASGGLSGPASVVGTPLTIGSWDGGKEFFTGRIDDVAAYSTSLSVTQVQRHYTAGTGGPTPTTQTVSVTRSGTGTGTVTSSPAGVSCPSTCSAAFPSGSSVTLTAAPGSGSTFTGWTAGACTGSTPACTFNVYAATSATASFATTTPPTTDSPTSSTYVAAVAADGPVGHWRLGETSGTNAADRAGGHPGTYMNAPALGQSGLLLGDADRAVGLDGTDDHVRIPHAGDLSFTTGLTLEAWVRPSGLPAAGGWASVLTKGESYSLQFAGPQLELTVIQGSSRKRLRAPVGAVVVGRTHHVVGTYDGAVQRLFVDGVQVASAPLTGPADATTAALQVGAWSGASELFAGTVDEAAVYGRALPAERVAAHYAAGTGGA